MHAMRLGYALDIQFSYIFIRLQLLDVVINTTRKIGKVIYIFFKFDIITCLNDIIIYVKY